ncbi:MAG: metallophosphoesterase [Christensenellaceae bacterium]|jgi:3-oxoacid CoA-transferase subunit A|nr:metallophosphoesterase [Christensenellaceae bacterium]
MKDYQKTFKRVFVTGDVHADRYDLEIRVSRIPRVSKDDLLIILGDSGFFYNVFHNDIETDYLLQDFANSLPITILCIQGNHELPFKRLKLERIKVLGASGYTSHGIYFVENGETMVINDKKCLVVGGAYSVDKPTRIYCNWAWWKDEELSDEELQKIEAGVCNESFDYVFTHTCPYSKLPREAFLPGVNQSEVSNRTELALERIKNSIEYKEWYCGHFHIEKKDGDVFFLFHKVKQII